MTNDGLLHDGGSFGADLNTSSVFREGKTNFVHLTLFYFIFYFFLRKHKFNEVVALPPVYLNILFFNLSFIENVSPSSERPACDRTPVSSSPVAVCVISAQRDEASHGNHLNLFLLWLNCRINIRLLQWSRGY